MDTNMQLRIIDFGLSLDRKNLEEETKSGLYEGTQGFMAPEIFSEKGNIDAYK